MLLVNDSLKFQMAILQIHFHFLLKKCENPLQCKDLTCYQPKNYSDLGLVLLGHCKMIIISQGSYGYHSHHNLPIIKAPLRLLVVLFLSST